MVRSLLQCYAPQQLRHKHATPILVMSVDISNHGTMRITQPKQSTSLKRREGLFGECFLILTLSKSNGECNRSKSLTANAILLNCLSPIYHRNNVFLSSIHENKGLAFRNALIGKYGKIWVRNCWWKAECTLHMHHSERSTSSTGSQLWLYVIL